MTGAFFFKIDCASARLWRFPILSAETATNGAKLPPWRQSALGGGANRRWAGGANRRWAVAPIDAGRWRQSARVGRAAINKQLLSHAAAAASDWPKRIPDMQHIDVDEHFD